MVTIDYNDELITLNKQIEAEYKPRGRLGLSEIGHECDRYLWYKHNGIEETAPDARKLMLFDLGSMIEDYLANKLGITRRQEKVEYKSLLGHIDGFIGKYLWECKSASKTNFNKFVKHGYQSDEKYKAQIHVYGKLTDAKGIKPWVYCKDDSRIHTEKISTDKSFAQDKLDRAVDICKMNVAPIGACSYPDFYMAKMCGYCEQCFGVSKQKKDDWW